MRKPLRRIPFTQEGLENAKKKYQEILASREEAVLNLKHARELGDLSENGLYKAARARLSSIDAQLNRLSFQIKLADVKEVNTSQVSIGTRVTVENGSNQIQYLIVGDLEADPKQKKISRNSPIGHALLGKKVGDAVIIETPGGKISCSIIRIELIT